jgi:glycosyltransferase involved in cell wall biosynthesis
MMILQTQGSLTEQKLVQSQDSVCHASPSVGKLRVLFLAPHPFYQDRGTPIDDSLFLKVLSTEKHYVDVLAYPEGRDIHYPNVEIHRTLKLPGVSNVRPGFSLKKLVYDLLMVVKAAQLIARRDYDVIQAVEESVFIALLFKLLLKIPYVYDMDSSVAQQMVEQLPLLSPLAPVLNWFEKIAVKNAKAVVPVCEAIAEDIAQHSPEKITVLPDISLLEEETPEVQEDLRADLNLQDASMVMYVGNLETYQGIDLLLESFAIAQQQNEKLVLVIIGGEATSIEYYQKKSQNLGIDRKVHFVGQRPAKYLSSYLEQADILVSPRIKGKNTPMKVYSYLDSGKPLLATDLLTHTQVLTHEVSCLSAATPEAFAAGMVKLAQAPELCQELGIAGRQFIQEKHCYAVFHRTVRELYSWLSDEIQPSQAQ